MVVIVFLLRRYSTPNASSTLPPEAPALIA
jgi:hypothetical protein